VETYRQTNHKCFTKGEVGNNLIMVAGSLRRRFFGELTTKPKIKKEFYHEAANSS